MPIPLDPSIARDLLARWDVQQERYIARREERFATIIEAVRLQCGGAPAVIDLCCGPGSLGKRLLAALPEATIWGVDADPLLQAIGANADDGIRWVEADLRGPGWSGFLDGRKVDAVVSTTALHWLSPPELLGVYRELAEAIRPGGIFLDGDHCPLPKTLPSLGKLAEAMTETLLKPNTAIGEEWGAWWEAASALPALQDAFRRREAVFSNRATEHPVTASFHQEALLTAGFAEAGTLWQIATDWIVAGIR
jgi:SAM-dependent methyltransferase